MMRSMFAGVTGLRNHQTRMDVIGNNIANVNTLAFKKSPVSFADALNQTMRGASRPTDTRGGTNPMQIGLGMNIGTINTVFGQGSMQSTGKNTDLGIQGDGFFILSDGGARYFTRAGAFDFDTSGNLISLINGLKVQGWLADENGVITSTAPGDLQDVRITPEMKTTPAKATENIVYAGNLSADAKSYDPATEIAGHETEFFTSLKEGTWSVPINVFDSLGKEHSLELLFIKNNVADAAADADPALDNAAGNIKSSWTVLARVADAGEKLGTTPTDFVKFSLGFDENGLLVESKPDAATPVKGIIEIEINDGTAGSLGDAKAITAKLDFNAITQRAAEDSTVDVSSRDGFKMGDLIAYSIDAAGMISGSYSNGTNKILGQIAMASFINPAGLMKYGENMYTETNNSGEASIGIAGTRGRGTIVPGNLEMSNVDLAQEFTDMIVTQRGFQANSRIITASDEMLQELVNLKR